MNGHVTEFGQHLGRRQTTDQFVLLYRLTLLIGCDVKMGTADQTEVEGGVTGLFQVQAHLRKDIQCVLHVVSECSTSVFLYTNEFQTRTENTVERTSM